MAKRNPSLGTGGAGQAQKKLKKRAAERKKAEIQLGVRKPKTKDAGLFARKAKKKK